MTKVNPMSLKPEPAAQAPLEKQPDEKQPDKDPVNDLPVGEVTQFQRVYAEAYAANVNKRNEVRAGQEASMAALADGMRRRADNADAKATKDEKHD